MRFFILIILLVTEPVFFNGNVAMASSSYYRWQDIQGDWHFSDKPPITAPTDKNISKILGQTVNTSKPPTNFFDRDRTKSNNNSVNKRKNNQKIARQLKLQSKKKQSCDILKVKLYTIQTKLRTGYKEPSGNKLRKKRRKINNQIYHQC